MGDGGRTPGRGGMALATAASVVAAVAVLSGCSGCDVSCGAPTPPDTTITAEATSLDDATARFVPSGDGEGDAGSAPIDVRVFGPVDALEEGTTYRVPLFDAGPGEPPQAFLPTDCDCTDAYITHADGDAVDTSWWAMYGFFHVSLTRLTVAITAAFFAVVAVWALVRMRRGLPV